MDSPQPAPDFDADKLAQQRIDLAESDGWVAPAFAGALLRRIARDLSVAYDAGRRAQLAADVAEIRRIVATTNPEPLAAAALTAMADRLAMIGGR